MTKEEKDYFKKQLEDIAHDVSYTPVDCGVKRMALVKIDALLDALENGIPKPPPEPEMAPYNKELLEMIKKNPLKNIEVKK